MALVNALKRVSRKTYGQVARLVPADGQMPIARLPFYLLPMWRPTP